MRTHTFRGKRYRIRLHRQPGCAGSCDHPKAPGKTLYLDPDPNRRHIPDTIPLGAERLYVACHESMHGVFWDLGEESVCEASADQARFLWRLGYRLAENPTASG